MASAILTSRNEPRSSDFMSRFTNNSNSNINFTRLQNFPNPNPNPNYNLNPNSSHFFIGNPSRDVYRKNHYQPPQLQLSAPPEATFIRSSINTVPASSSGYRYITFRLGSYTRRELHDLKKRLMSDLERVRILRHWICTAPVPKKHYQPPQLEPPPPPPAVKTAVGQKRTKPCAPVRETKKHCGRGKGSAQKSKLAMRNCGQILSKLMTHKHGWVFNTPVDAAALQLYDYHNIIKRPMDLGTINSKLGKNEYDSPIAFASDVRLTFENAMVYNGKGSEVFVMAERLLLLFEELFNSATVVKQVVKKQQNRFAKLVEKPVLNTAGSGGDGDGEGFVMQMQMEMQKPVAHEAVKLEKPEMTADEKAELAGSLYNLQVGPEGMEQIMSIVKKGALGLVHQGDEVELDLAVLDNETLWELHGFIGRFNRKEGVTNLVSCVQADNYPGSEIMVEEECRKREAGDEDVDIGEELQLTNYPSVKIEKDTVNVSSSSSGSSSSDSDSSSSDSGSGSSSGNSSYNEQEANSTPKGFSMGN